MQELKSALDETRGNHDQMKSDINRFSSEARHPDFDAQSEKVLQ